MGKSKKRKIANESNSLSYKIVQIHEYEICCPGPLGQQSKDWLCSTIPTANDYQITSRALGAPVVKFTTTWDGAPVDVYVVENFQNIPLHLRIVNTDATIAHRGYLLSIGCTIARAQGEPPILGANVARYTQDWTRVRLRHQHAGEITSGWCLQRLSPKPIIEKISSTEYNIYISDDRDIDKIVAAIRDCEALTAAA